MVSINIKHIMLVLSIIQLMCTVYCGLPDTALNNSEPRWKQLQALEHVYTFLNEIQNEIKESRDLLRSLPFDSFFNYSTQRPLSTSSKWTMQKNLLEFLSPTISQGLLRTLSTNTVADESNLQNGTTSFIRSPPPRATTDRFQDARDYVLPDFGPDYKDIFAPDVERQGDTNKEIMASVTMGLDMLFVTEPKPGEVLYGDVAYHMTTKDPHPTLHSKLVKDSTGYISVGFEMFCMLVASKDPGTVKAVLERSEKVIASIEHERYDRLEWMHEPMRTVLDNWAGSMSPSLLQIDELQTKARLMMETMKSRRQLLGNYVNRIIDFADGLVSEEHGEEIFDVLDAFREFPHTDKKGKNRTAEEMCKDLIMAFINPFYFETTDRKRLVNAANRAIRERFAHLHIFRRKVVRGSKTDDHHGHHRMTTNGRYEFKQAWYTLRNSRIPIYGSKYTISHRNSAMYKRVLQRRIYNKKQPKKRSKNSNNFNNPLQSYRDNYLKYVNAYKHGTNKRASTRKFHDKINVKPITNRNVMNTRNVISTTNNAKVTKVPGVQKTERIQTRFNKAAKSQRRKPKINTKEITRYTDSYKKNERRPIEHRRADIVLNRNYSKKQNKLVTKSKILHANQIKKTTNLVINNSKIKNDDNAIVSMDTSDEKMVLDVKLLNRLLNVTSEESLTVQSLLDESVATDDDEDVLNNLYDAFYNK